MWGHGAQTVSHTGFISYLYITKTDSHLTKHVPCTLKKYAMGKTKKNLDDIKKEKDVKPIPKGDMNKITGGKSAKDKKKHNNGCGGILPQ